MAEELKYDCEKFDALTEQEWQKLRKRNKDRGIEYFQNANVEERVEKLKELEKYGLKQNKITVKKTRDSPINVVLFGKTGHGKSATANSMINKDYFKASGKAASCTKTIGVCEMEHNGQKYKIVDTPGLFDTVKEQAEIKFELSKVIDECVSGIDAFMYVHNGTVRFSPEEQNTVKEIEGLFGDEIAKYSFLVVTRAEAILEDKDLEKFVQEGSEVQELKELIEKLGYRVVAVNNMSKTTVEKRFMQTSIFDMIALVQQHTDFKAYTHVLFEKAKEKQKEAEEKRKKLQEAERQKEAEQTHQSIQVLEEFIGKEVEDYFRNTKYEDVVVAKEDEFKSVIESIQRKLKADGSKKVRKALQWITNINKIAEKMAQQAFVKRVIQERGRAENEEKMKKEMELRKLEEEMSKKEEENKRVIKDKEELKRKQEEMERELEKTREEIKREMKEREEKDKAEIERVQRENEEKQKKIAAELEAEKKRRKAERERARKAVDERVKLEARTCLRNHSKFQLEYMGADEIRSIRNTIIDDLPYDDKNVFTGEEIDQKIKKEINILKDSMEYTVPEHLIRPVVAVWEGAKSAWSWFAG